MVNREVSKEIGLSSAFHSIITRRPLTSICWSPQLMKSYLHTDVTRGCGCSENDCFVFSISIFVHVEVKIFLLFLFYRRSGKQNCASHLSDDETKMVVWCINVSNVTRTQIHVMWRDIKQHVQKYPVFWFIPKHVFVSCRRLYSSSQRDLSVAAHKMSKHLI